MTIAPEWGANALNDTDTLQIHNLFCADSNGKF